MKKKTFWLIAATVALAIMLTFTVALFFVGDPYYDKGLEIIDLMDKAVQSKEYMSAFGVSDDMTDFAIDKVGHGAPKAVYKISFTESSIEKFAEDIGFDTDRLPQELRELMLSKLHSSIASYIISYSYTTDYVQYNALSTASSVTLTFSGGTQNALYLYVYEDACPAIISFTAGEGLSVSATGHLLFGNDNQFQSFEDVEKCFEKYSPKVEKIKG